MYCRVIIMGLGKFTRSPHVECSSQWVLIFSKLSFGLTNKLVGKMMAPKCHLFSKFEVFLLAPK